MKYRFSPQKRRPPKIIKAAIIIAALILAALYVIGLTLGSGSEKRSEISQAVEENRSLRSTVAERDARISELEAEVERLNEVIASMPTLPPATPEPAAEEEYEQTSPRDYYYDDDED